MLASARIPLGAPGVYLLTDAPQPRLNPQRMDVCAFVGVAPRGPAYVPLVDESHPDGYLMMADLARPRQRSVAVAVKSFDEYQRLYGAFEGPGLLPYAVATFFEQGGLRAYIVRIVPTQSAAPPLGQPPNLAGMATGIINNVCTQALSFRARDQGSWGDLLNVQMSFSTRAVGFTNGPANTVLLGQATLVFNGTLLLLTDSNNHQQFAYCRGLREIRDPMGPFSQWQVQFDMPLSSAPVRIDIVEASVGLLDGDDNGESFDGLGLTPDHPRFIATVLCNESTLVWPDYDWAGVELLPGSPAVNVLRGSSTPFQGGVDGYADITFNDFFDGNWSAASETAGDGISALAELPDATQLVVPDLYVPEQWAGDQTATDEQIVGGGADFSPCVHVVTTTSASNTPPSALTGLILDPRSSTDLQQVAALQNQLIAFCEATQNLIALIDVPPGLSLNQTERWRAQFDSAWCAAYHPWLIASRRAFSTAADRADTLLPIPPSAVAAGIVARKEIQYGIQYGPANEIASEIVNQAEKLPAGRVDLFHPQGINCFVREADGIHLVSARTLSLDSDWRQLSVRRLMLMLRRTLLIETQWAVFEPNGPKLWRDLRHAIEGLLQRLFRVGAFAGATAAQSYFVRVRTDTLALDNGQLLIEIGVAPAEPIEFIVVQLRRNGDGTLTLD